MKNTQLKAVNPVTQRTVSAQQFLKEEGINYRNKGIVPYCPCCKQPMKLYGAQSKVRPLTFKHVADSDHCLIKESFLKKLKYFFE